MNHKNFSSERINYCILFTIMAVSIVCRLIATADSQVIPGIGSMYYPLQVRCLIERGTLAYSDMPLVFWMEALTAKAIILAGNMPASFAIVLACRLINVVIPSLIVIPVFFLAKSITNNTLHPAYMAVILALSVLNPSVLVLFSIDFDKNAVSMLFVYMSIYYLWEYIKHREIKAVIMTAVSVFLTLLTHFGCFSSLFLFLVILMLITGIFNFKKLVEWLKGSKIRVVLVISALIALILLPVVVKLIDNQRFMHLASYLGAPFQLFSHSFFLMLIRGKFMDWPNMLYFIIINAFSIFSVIAFFKLRKRLKKEESSFFLSLVLWFVFLSNPFLNMEVFRRLLIISLIPLTVIIIFVFYYFRKPAKMTIAIILALLLILTVATSGARGTFISKEEYTELREFGKIIPNPSSTIVLAQHRLEFWTSWTLHMKSGQLNGIKPCEYPKYSQVLYIVQKSNKFQEERPKATILIHSGKYFDLYKIY